MNFTNLLEQSPRMTLELILVMNGVKPADVIDWGRNKYQRAAFLKAIKETPNIKAFKIPGDEHDQIYYYNTKLVTQEFINEWMLKPQNYQGQDKRVTEGIINGFPSCCIIAHEEGRIHNEKMPMTEHYWCSPECKASQRIQKIYTQEIIKALPECTELTQYSLMQL